LQCDGEFVFRYEFAVLVDLVGNGGDPSHAQVVSGWGSGRRGIGIFLGRRG
jgi:hypothetical protein